MRTSKFSETQIVSILNEAEAGLPVKEVCRKHGISSATYHKWKSKYGGLSVSELKRMKELEAENAKLNQLTQTLALRIGRYLERQGLLESDVENSYLGGDDLEVGAMAQVLGSSITYRIAMGPQRGRKVFTLQTLPACDESFDAGVGKVAGFSLHAGVSARADERQKLERLCRYITRPAVSEKRLSLTPNGNVRYQLKTPYRDGTTHVIFEPLDFISGTPCLDDLGSAPEAGVRH